MTTIDKLLPCLTPSVRRAVEQFIERPTERNACYVTGYLVAASEAGALLPERRAELIQWIANTERGAGVLPLTEGERSLYHWREGGMIGVIIRFKRNPIPVVAVPAEISRDGNARCCDKAGNDCAFIHMNCIPVGAYGTCTKRDVVFRKVEQP